MGDWETSLPFFDKHNAMAQVKKFQTGGTLKINGKDYTVDQLNEYMNSGGFSSQERAALAGTINAIAQGASRTFDRNANSISGEDVHSDFTDFYGNDRKAEKNSGRSRKWANRQARKNSDYHIVNSALERLGGIEDYYNKKSEEKKSKDTSKILKKGSGYFQYDDETGAYIDNATNYDYFDVVDRAFRYLKDSDKDSWDTSVLTESQLEWLNDWNNKHAGYEEGLKERIKQGKINDDDKILLSAFGLSQEEIESLEHKQQKLFTEKGYDYNKYRPYFEINDNGQLVARKIDGKSVFSPFGGSGNYWFNDSFARNNSQYDFLKDHFLINGVLYKSSDAENADSDLYKYLHQSGGFYDKNKVGDWVGANELIRQHWDSTPRSNYQLASESDVTSDFFKTNPGYRWNSVTGAYEYPLEAGQQLLEIYDPSQDVDMFGHGVTKFGVFDANGNLVKWIDNDPGVTPGNLTGEAAKPLRGRTIIRQPGSVYNNMEVLHPEGSPVGFFWDPQTERLIYNGDLLFANDTEGKGYAFPKEIAKVLMSNPNFINNLLTSGLLPDFQRTLGSTINSQGRDMWQFVTDTMSERNWRELGFSDDQISLLMDYFDKLSNHKYAGSRNATRGNRLVDVYNPAPISVQKLGGKIEYLRKFQPGGTVGTTKTQGFTEYKLSEPFKNHKNFSEIGVDKISDFTASDWLELGGLAGDLTGIALGFSGAPIASGVAGAIGSTAGFAADINRDGLDWGDVGNYGLNLGLDLISAIPFAGSAAQSVKAAGKIRKAGKTILKVFSNPWVVRSLAGMGIGSAVKTSAEKIINGEAWTMRDVRNVINGLSGVMTLKKTGLTGGGTTKQDVGEINVKIKGKDTKIALEEADLKRIANGSKDDIDKTLRQIIVEKYPKISKSKSKIKAKDIDFSPAKVEEKLGLKFWKGKQPTGEYDFNITSKSVAPEFTAEGLKNGEQSQEQLLHFLRSGEWKTLDTNGQIVDIGDQLRAGRGTRNKNLSNDVKTAFKQASFVLPNMWGYQEDYVMPQSGYAAMPVFDPYSQYFKDGGKIQYAKCGKKITKHKDTSTLPNDPFSQMSLELLGKNPITILDQQSEQPEQQTQSYPQMIDIDNPSASISPIVSDAIKKQQRDQQAEIGAAARTDVNGGALRANSTVNGISLTSAEDAIKLPRVETTPKPQEVKTNQTTPVIQKTGGPKGTGSPKTGLGWNIAGNVAGSLGKAASAWMGSKAQMDLAKQLQVPLQTTPIRSGFKYRDIGIDSAYDNAINQQQSFVRNYKSTDPSLNTAVGIQAADKMSQLELDRGLKKASAFQQQLNDHNTQLRQQNLDDAVRADANAKLLAQKHNAILQQKGAYIAQNQGIAQGVIGDIASIGKQAVAGKKALEAFDAKRSYNNKLSEWQTEFNKIAKNNLVDGQDFNTWVEKTHGDDYWNLRRNFIASQYAKRGAKLRPTEEQIKIDNNKIRAKAIERLNKQAFELLKMALS